MACPQIITGDQFVSRVLGHIDCQSRYLGSYGYEALSEPGSLAAMTMTGLLTLFVALWGVRLLFGPTPGARDITYDVLKVGIVLTLAFSWPAFRTVVHDVVIDAPGEIAVSLANPALETDGSRFVQRLQRVDNALVDLTDVGTGRGSAQSLEGDPTEYRYGNSALRDENALGWSRLVFLSGMFGSLALLRLMAGLLLALAPLAAGLLLFEATRGLFAGWLRGLVLTLVGSVGVTVVMAVELAVLEPWLRDALQVRGLGYAASSAPIELFAMTLSFAIVQFGMIWFLGKVAFMRGWIVFPPLPSLRPETASNLAQASPAAPQAASRLGRAQRISEQVETRMEYERSRLVQVQGPAARSSGGSGSANGTYSERQPSLGSTRRLGNAGRRTGQAASLSAQKRDSTT